MTTVEIIRTIILRETGGIPFVASRAAWHMADRGGWTRAGMTAVNVGEFLQLGRPATPDELNALTEAQAFAFYDARYVGRYRDVPDPLRTLLVDWSVTSGHDDPTKALQIALRQRGVYVGAIDGIIGPMTRGALVADPDARQTYREVIRARIEHYALVVLRDPPLRELMRVNPTVQAVFLRGWLRRACEFIP